MTSPASPAEEAPFIRAPEGARAVFAVTFAAACLPLLGGLAFFGWRAAWVTGICVTCCAAVEWLYYRVTRAPALLGRSHAYLTGLLLALTLPAFVPWYVPAVAAAFAILVGKAVFGGVGHFLWQPALVGRLAVAVMFPGELASPPGHSRGLQPVLARSHLVVGDVCSAARGSDPHSDMRRWADRPAPDDADAFLLTPPVAQLRGLTRPEAPAHGSLVFPPPDPLPGKSPALLQMPPLGNLLYGARPGGIGETAVILIAVGGAYLVYRSYIRWQLPVAFLAAAWCTAAVAPIYLAGPNNTVQTLWLPLLTPEGGDVGLTYVNYQILSGELLLAACFLAAEMTSRPIGAGGQLIFGLGCGTVGMILQLYTETPIPSYLAVLAMNTLTPTLDRLWRPRVFGARRFGFRRR